MGDQEYLPQEISAMILRKLKVAAETDLKQPVTKAVITVPAYFNDTQRQATREAGELAGLDVVRILNEPTAAALTYAPNPEHDECFLVYDLGGGTFDVSIVRAEAGVFEVLASHGDTKLGGDDFDQLLLDHVAQEFLTLYGVDLRQSPVSRARLLRAVENAKKVLSDHAFARIEEEFIAEKEGIPLHLSQELSRAEYEELITPLIAKTLECVQKALLDAKLTPQQLNQVVLVGGSTRTPMIGRLLELKLGKPVHREVHPDLCVAMGAAVQAALASGQTLGAVLVDITPHTLGIKCLDIPSEFSRHANEFRFARIIPRNTPLPAIRSEVFCTVSDNQKVVDVEIYQGESDDVRRNHRVGKFLIEGLARVPAGNQIIVELKLTLDGTLLVSAKEKETGLKKQITIENAMAQFAVEDRQAAVERLKQMWTDPTPEELEPSDDEEIIAQDLASLIVDDDDEGYSVDTEEYQDSDDDDEANDFEPSAQSPSAVNRITSPLETDEGVELLLDKAAKLRDRATPEDQSELDKLAAELRVAYQASDRPKIQAVSSQLGDLLFYLEDV
jgi:molecular chaperone DnaK